VSADADDKDAADDEGAAPPPSPPPKTPPTPTPTPTPACAAAKSPKSSTSLWLAAPAALAEASLISARATARSLPQEMALRIAEDDGGESLLSFSSPSSSASLSTYEVWVFVLASAVVVVEIKGGACLRW